MDEGLRGEMWNYSGVWMRKLETQWAENEYVERGKRVNGEKQGKWSG